MLPSRGLRWSRQTIAITRNRLEPLSARHCSTLGRHAPVRSSPLPSRNTASASRILAGNSLSRSVPLIGAVPGVRFASTAPAAAATTSAASAAATTDLKTAPVETIDLSDVSDISSMPLIDMPVQIGYLKAMGLDYGWGPTAMMEWLIEHIHVYAGTPWWATIAISAVAIRAVLFKAFINAADNAARMQAVKPITDPLTKKMMAARGDQLEVMQIRAEIQAINKRAGVKVWKSLVPLAQIFTGYGTFVLLRGMAHLPVPGLETGGALWFQNLAVHDPYFILPASTALALHWVLRKGGEAGATAASPNAMKLLQVILPLLTLIVTSFIPAAVQLSFFVSGILSLVQSALFRRPGFRSFFKMYRISAPGSIKPSIAAPGAPIMRAAPPTQAELNSTYKPGRATLNSSDVNPDGTIKRFVQGAVHGASKDIRTTISEAVRSGREMAGQGKDGLAQRQAKADKAAAAAYETKRQKEIQEERWQREQERRARKATKGKRS